MRAKALLAGLITLLVVMVGMRPAAQTPTSTERKLQLTFDGKGYATLIAQNVSVAEIFAEWSRVGGSKVLNAEKLPGTRIPSIRFENIAETELVEALVRQSKAQGAGFIVAPRLVSAEPTPSLLQTISILPSSTPTSSYVATSMPGPIYQPPPVEDPTELPPVRPIADVGPASQPASGQQQPPANRGPGVASPVQVVPVAPVPPTTPPPPSTTGRGRGGF